MSRFRRVSAVVAVFGLFATGVASLPTPSGAQERQAPDASASTRAGEGDSELRPGGKLRSETSPLVSLSNEKAAQVPRADLGSTGGEEFVTADGKRGVRVVSGLKAEAPKAPTLSRTATGSRAEIIGGSVSVDDQAADSEVVRIEKKNGKSAKIGVPDLFDDAGKSTKTSGRRVQPRKSDQPGLVELGDVVGSGTVLDYQTLPEGVKETITITSPQRKRLRFDFPIEAPGLTARPKDRGYELVDASGAVQFTIPAMFAFDSRGGAGTPGNAYVYLESSIRSTASGFVITGEVPGKWLGSKDRVYPIVVDPTVLLQPWSPMNLGYMPWGDNSGAAAFSSWTNDMVFGNWWGSNWKSYLQFDPTLFNGRSISQATVKLFVPVCDNQTTPGSPYANAIHARQLSSVYFFGQTWPGPSATGDVAVVPSGPNTYATFNVTSMAQQWASNPGSNFGLQFDMGSATGYCRAQRTSPWGYQTTIEVVYNEPVNASETGLLSNFGFESGTTGWAPCLLPASTQIASLASTAHSGSRVGRITISAAGAGSVCQTVNASTGPSVTQNVNAYVRSTTGGTVAGRLTLWELGSSPSEAHADFVVGPSWTAVPVTKLGTSTANGTVRVELSFPANSVVDVDSVVLSNNGPPPPTQPAVNRLDPGQSLSGGTYIQSPNRSYRLVQQASGATQLIGPSGVTWNNPLSLAGAVLTMGFDGNLVVTATGNGGTIYWQSYTAACSGQGVYATMQDDGSFVLYRANGTPVWSTNTGVTGCSSVPVTPPPTTTSPPTTTPPPPPPIVNVSPLPLTPQPAGVRLLRSQSGDASVSGQCMKSAPSGRTVVSGYCTTGMADYSFGISGPAEWSQINSQTTGKCLSVNRWMSNPPDFIPPIDSPQIAQYPGDGAWVGLENCDNTLYQYWGVGYQPNTSDWILSTRASDAGAPAKCASTSSFQTFSGDATTIGYVTQINSCSGYGWQRYRLDSGATYTPPGPGLAPRTGDPFRDGIPTRIEIPGSAKCIAHGSWSVQVEESGMCTTVTPVLSPGGYKLKRTTEPSTCLSDQAGTLSWLPCNASTTWNDLDPFGLSRYPDSTWSFPIWYRNAAGSPLCISASSSSVGSSVFVAGCGDGSLTQVWTDPYRFDVSAGVVDNIGNYDYAPAVVGDRMFWCTGLGEKQWPDPVEVRTPAQRTGADAIVSISLGSNAAPNLSRGYAFYLDPLDGLACDPHPVKIATGYRVYYTRGNAAGLLNGVSYFETDNSGQIVGTSSTNNVVIGPSSAGYGNGQPSVTPRPAGGYLLAYRANGSAIANRTDLAILNGTGTGVAEPAVFAPRTGPTLEEDGAAPEVFFSGDRLFKLVTGCQSTGGAGYIGVRTYTYDAQQTTFTREESLEKIVNGVKAREGIAIGAGSDGCAEQSGLVRGVNNEPVVTSNSVAVWRTSGSASQGSWRLLRVTVPLP